MLTISQLSVATGVPSATFIAPQPEFTFAMIGAGTNNTGLVVSTTVTVCIAVEVLPEASFTVQLTSVVPIGKTAGALFVTNATEQLSAVVGKPSATLNATQALDAVTVTLFGAVIVGNSVSFTVTN
jgi:hypothetical protein